MNGLLYLLIFIGLLLMILVSGCISGSQDEYTDYGKIVDFEIHENFWGTSCTVETNTTKAYVTGSWCYGIDATGKHHLLRENEFNIWIIKEEGEFS